MLRPHLVQAYRTSEAVTELRRGLALLDRDVDGLGYGLVIASGDGCIRFATRQAARCLERYFPGRRPGPDRLPRAVRDWVAHEDAALRATDDAPRPRGTLVMQGRAGRLVVRLASEAGRCLLLFEGSPGSPHGARWSPTG